MTYLKEMAESGYNFREIDDFHTFMIPWLLSENGVGPQDIVVDIGAGQGHCLIPLQEKGYRNLIAVDHDRFNFEVFKKLDILPLYCNIEIEPLNIEDNSVDAVLCFHLIEHLNTPANLLSEAHRILKCGKKIFFVTPDWIKQYKTFWRDPTHKHPYDKESIERLLRIYEFDPIVSSWNARFGLGRLKVYRRFPRLGMIGMDILAIGKKKDS